MPASVGAILGGAGIQAGASLVGSAINGIMSGHSFDFQREMWDKNYNAQKEFAQNSMQWRVNDARKAGLHPLAALGQMGSSYTPTSVYDSGADVGSAVANAGTAIGNAMGQIGMLKAEAELESARLDNQLKMVDLQNKSNELIAGQNAKALSELEQAKQTYVAERDAGHAISGNRQGPTQTQSDLLSDSWLGAAAKFGAAAALYKDNTGAESRKLKDADSLVFKHTRIVKSNPWYNGFMPVYTLEKLPSYDKLSPAQKKRIDDYVTRYNNEQEVLWLSVGIVSVAVAVAVVLSVADSLVGGSADSLVADSLVGGSAVVLSA